MSARRSFLKTASAAAAASVSMIQPQVANAKSMTIPIGLQLYTVGKEMDVDPFGTLKRVSAVGYRTVELSPMAKVPTAELKKALDDLGLKNPAGHYMLPDLMTKL